MRAWCLAVVPLMGCQLLFRLENDPAACITQTSVRTTFEDSPADDVCRGIGPTNQVDSEVTVVGGQLHIQPLPDKDSTVGGCLSEIEQPFTTGVFLEVIEPLANADFEFMFFRAEWVGTDMSSILQIKGTELVLYREVGGDPRQTLEAGRIELGVETRWWRMRFDGGDTILGEVSPDGRGWSTFADHLVPDPVDPPDSVKISVAMGAFAAELTPSTAIIDNINICPP